MRPVRLNTCWAPPERAAEGRAGCAKSRCLVTVRRGLTRRFGAGVALRASERLGARVAGRDVSEAGIVGRASRLGGVSTRAISCAVGRCGFGAAKCLATLASRPYV